MPEPITAPQPTPTAPVAPAPSKEAPVEVKAADLVKREVPKAPEAPAEQPFYNSDDIEKLVQDPKQREILKGIYNNMKKGLDKKFEEVAGERKRIEAEKSASNTWTPEKLRSVLNDPTFVEASKQIMRESQGQMAAPSTWEGSQEEWSALSDTDKARFSQLEQKVNGLLSQQDRLLVEQADQEIKARFPDYDPSKVNSFQSEIATGKVSEAKIRELIWKATNFDRYVENSYRYGYEDRQQGNKERVNAMSFGGGQATTSDERPVRGENESPTSYFRRIAQFNLSRSKENIQK